MSRIIANNIRHNDATVDSITLDSAGNVSAPGNLSVTGTSTLTDDLAVDTDTLFVDASTNRVGIGTTSVRERLHISGTGDIKTEIATTSTGSGADVGLEFTTGDGHNWIIQTGNVVSGGLRVYDIQNNSERLRITNNGTLQLRNSPGIDFSQIQTNASGMTSETLDSYEEGTWTPSANGTATHTTQLGHYTKIGRLVTVHFVIQINAIGTGSPTQIHGLPFTPAPAKNGAGSCDYFQGTVNNLVALVPYAEGNKSYLQMRTLTAAATGMANVTVLQNGTRVDATVTYVTT